MGYEGMCPRYEQAVEVLGKKWTGLILRILLAGPKRFSEFRRQVPTLSDRLLSSRLKELEAEGIVRRQVVSSRPVAVAYELTEKGRALEPVVAEIQGWANVWCEPAGAGQAERTQR